MPITLSREEIGKINAALTKIKEAKTEILKAKQAGIDIQAEEDKLLTQEKRLLAIKRVYASSKA